MITKEMMTYAAPERTAQARGIVNIAKDDQGSFTVNDVLVTGKNDAELFTTLTCADGATYYLFTAIFRQVDR